MQPMHPLYTSIKLGLPNHVNNKARVQEEKTHEVRTFTTTQFD